VATEIREKLHSYVLSTFLAGENPDTLCHDTPLITSGIVDSLAVLDMVTFIEQAFAVRLAQEDLGSERLDTIELIEAVILERRAS
jgi:acyl carrier protein